MTNNNTSYAFFLLLLLIIVWGLGWPIAKLGLDGIPPLWFGVTRFAIATLCLFGGLAACKRLTLPTSKDIPILLSISILQMAFFVIFSNIGLHYVDAARSSILAYTIPLWATPLAVLVFKEKLSAAKLFGLILGLGGVVLLFNPASFNWHDSNVLIGNSFLILSAMCVAICILHIRNAKWVTTPLQLLPWQTLIATFILLTMALIFEPHPVFHLTLTVINSALYIGILATVLGYWLSIEISKNLPSVTTSLCLLGIPVLGVISSHFIFKQSIPTFVIVSLCLIVSGIVFVIKDSKPKEIANEN